MELCTKRTKKNRQLDKNKATTHKTKRQQEKQTQGHKGHAVMMA